MQHEYHHLKALEFMHLYDAASLIYLNISNEIQLRFRFCCRQFTLVIIRTMLIKYNLILFIISSSLMKVDLTALVVDSRGEKLGDFYFRIV